jgi:hypothetical protein
VTIIFHFYRIHEFYIISTEHIVLIHVFIGVCMYLVVCLCVCLSNVLIQKFVGLMEIAQGHNWLNFGKFR